MERSENRRDRIRRPSAALLTALLVALVMPPARAQHEGHGQHTTRAPKPAARRAAARRKTPRRPSRTTRRAAPTPRAGRRSSSAAPRRATPAPTATPEPRTAPPASAHEGHTGHEGHTPTPSPTPAADPHAGHTPQRPQEHRHETPQATPSPAPTPAAPTPRPSPQQQQPDPHAGHGTPQTTQPQSVQPRAVQPPPPAGSQPAQPAGPALRLEELEALALGRNPTLAQAEAAVRAAEGRARQAGMMPNPTVGYSAENVSTRRPSETAEHLFFVEQTFPLGGKLSKARRVFAGERDVAVAGAAAQRQRVLNEVRALYSEALGAQRLVELRADLARLAREAVGISRELYNVGQADKPDLLEIEIEARRAEIEQLKAENDRELVWQQLAAAVGDPALRPAPLAGSLEDVAAALDEQQLLPLILRDSPEVRAATARVARARAALERERAARAPDLFVRGGAGYNQERGEAFGGGRVGPVVAVETGLRLPLWNRNQGGIAAAEAEVAIAERDVERLRLVIGARLASSLRTQRNARQVAEKYRAEIIPAARAAYEMYLANFRQMAASYPQVLIAQRTLFQVQVEYARALVELRRGLVSLRGFLLTGGALDPVGATGEGTSTTTTGESNDH